MQTLRLLLSALFFTGIPLLEAIAPIHPPFVPQHPAPRWHQLASLIPKEQKHFVIVVPSFNNQQWYLRNLDSILGQTYHNYSIVYVNDCSTDATLERVTEYQRVHELGSRMSILTTPENRGGLASIYTAVQTCKDTDIIVELDGDDWFAHQHVLELLNKVYDDPDVWLTYGQYCEYPSGRFSWVRPLSAENADTNNFRGNHGWMAPTRSFYAKLFKKINPADLQDDHGAFFRVSWDHAMMWPMCEMATSTHIRLLPDLSYIYNKANPLGDSVNVQQKQFDTVDLLCARKRYSPLDEPLFAITSHQE